MGRDQRLAPYQILLLEALQICAARIGIVLLERRDEGGVGQAGGAVLAQVPVVELAELHGVAVVVDVGIVVAIE